MAQQDFHARKIVSAMTSRGTFRNPDTFGEILNGKDQLSRAVISLIGMLCSECMGPYKVK